MNNHFPQYTTDYISGVMSLRKPQTQSLKILEEIVNTVQLRKDLAPGWLQTLSQWPSSALSLRLLMKWRSMCLTGILFI